MLAAAARPRPRPRLRLRVRPRPRPTAGLSTAAAAAQHRLDLFAAARDDQQQRRDRRWAELRVGSDSPSLVVLKRGTQPLPIHSPHSSPLDVAKELRRRNVAYALINGLPWDLSRPFIDALDGGVTPLELEFVDTSDERAKPVLAHSAAHVLGLALEREYGDELLLSDGPPVNEGAQGEFFYEAYLPGGRSIHEADLATLTDRARAILKEGEPFERVQVSREVARAMFQYNKLKLALLDRISPDAPITVYRLGSLVDLCTGPHLPSAAAIGAIKMHKVSGAHDPHDTSLLLQRVYGVAFPRPQNLEEWEHARAEALKRDHRAIGSHQQLFMLHHWSPGSPFFLPHGMRIINKLTELMRHEYRHGGYDEVGSPSLYNSDLWKTSGHWELYKDDMFVVHGGAQHGAARPGERDDASMGLKPMNCPGHCLMYSHGVYSYRDLPVRMADFSALHRNEKPGALSGLTRVRKFHQDDAHIFCRHSQIRTEVAACLEMVERVYGYFGMPVKYALSTRPDDYMGDLEAWREAEASLIECLNTTGRPYSIHDKDGAFYGPKIDVSVTDALGREHQTATIQLDFQLPLRFNLHYKDEQGALVRPVIIHRAMLGSLERVMALLTEHYGGKVLVVPVSAADPLVDYAQGIATRLRGAGFYADADLRKESLRKKIRSGWDLSYNYMLVVGDAELRAGTIGVRTRGSTDTTEMAMGEFLDKLATEAQVPSAARAGPLEPIQHASCS